MKSMHPVAIVLAVSAASCGSGPPRFGTTSHGGGADVPVWMYDGYLSTGEEPIHRKANGNAPVIFKLDHDTETDLYKFPADAVSFVSPTGEFNCATVNETLVKCARTGTAAGSFKYMISVVLRSDITKRTTLDPFIITH
ncbi:MAG: hypothetical protein ABIQ06_09515 [Caldimonas sp.]